MNIGNYKFKRRSFIATIILLLGLFVGIYLLGGAKILTSRANAQILRSFDALGPIGTYMTRLGDNSFETDALDVTVTFQDPGMIAGDGSVVPDVATSELCTTDGDYTDGFRGCDPSSGCGWELWQCTADPSRTPEPFPHPNPSSDCYKPEFNEACLPQ